MLPRSLAALLSVSLLLSLSCGGRSTKTERLRDEGVDEGGSEPRGDTRLRAMYVESADGIGVFRYFEDPELDLSCNFVATDSGPWRCLPAGDAAVHTSELVYTDAACTEPHAALYTSTREGPAACTPPRHLVVGANCGTAREVFAIGPMVSVDTRYRIVDGVCSVSDMDTDELSDLFSLTPIALDRFEPATFNVGEETGGIVPLDLSSEGGTRVRLGFRDAEERFDCRVAETDDGIRCIPTDLGLVVGIHFADTECTVPAAVLSYCADERTEIPFARDLSTRAYHRGGSRLERSYLGSMASCMPSQQNIGFAVAEEIPITRFAPAREETLAGQNVAVTVYSVGSASLPAMGIRSTAYGDYPCFIANGTDKTLRCMPSPETFRFELFADSACTQGVRVAHGEFLAERVSGVCPEEVRVYARGDRHTGPVYAVVEGTCGLAHDRPPNDSERAPHYVFATEIPPTEFAPLFEVAK